MNETEHKPLDNGALTDEALDTVAGGGRCNPFGSPIQCTSCQNQIIGNSHMVSEGGATAYLCDGCYGKYLNERLQLLVELTPPV